MENKPFRPIAMMLKIQPLLPAESGKVSNEALEDLLVLISDNLESSDTDMKPQASLLGEITLPIKAPHHIKLSPVSEEAGAMIELGYTVQQILLFMTYLNLAYSVLDYNNSDNYPVLSETAKTEEKRWNSLRKKNPDKGNPLLRRMG